jgi:hypothetical protein
MKPRRFILTGAALVAALMLAGPALAQEFGEDALLGNPDLSPQLEEASLFSEPGLEAEDAHENYENAAVIRQNGLGNRAEVNQTSSAYGAFAIIAQYGEDNLADVQQCGCGNFVDIIQDGSANESEITQTGRGNVFVHRQYGDGLALSVTQYGGAQIAITQTGP